MILTTKLRLKDKNKEFLESVSNEVNFIWNAINGRAISVFNEYRKLKSSLNKEEVRAFFKNNLSEYSFSANFIKGTSEECHLSQPSINLINAEYFNKCRQSKKTKLKFRNKDSGAWIPIRKDCIKYTEKQCGNKYQYTFDISFGKVGGRKTFRTFKDRKITGEIKAASFVEHNGKWFFNVSYEVEQRDNNLSNAVGIDWGVKNMITSSDGVLPNQNDREKYLRQVKILEDKIKALQKRISHQEEFLKSSNRLSPNAKLPRKLYNKNLIRNRKHLKVLYKSLTSTRSDYTHKQTTFLATNYNTICVEDLNVKGMSKSAKGTVESPGTNVAQKSGLNREILKNNPYEIIRQLEYKTQLNKGELIKVNPAHTSQTCSECSCCDEKNRKSQAEFKCIKCGFECNADINGAKNILYNGIFGIQDCS